MTGDRERILDRLRECKTALVAEFSVERLALFGLMASGEETVDSDVDILVEVPASIGLRFVEQAERLESYLGKRVDLVSRRALKPSLWKQLEPELIDV